MMEREINKISTDDIRGTDLPTEYIAGFALLIVALVGGFIFYSMRNANNSLPSYTKNRLD